jgi:hypothetical protein
VITYSQYARVGSPEICQRIVSTAERASGSAYECTYYEMYTWGGSPQNIRTEVTFSTLKKDLL